MAEHNKGKKWTDEEENILTELLKNNENLEECSLNIGRTIGSIKVRIEVIIYKKIIYEKQSFEELLYLKKYVDISFDEIIRKYKNKINKTNKNYKKEDFEKIVLNKLEKIILKQEEMSLDILKEKDKEINKLKLIIDDLREIKKKNENTITDLVNTINKINL